MNDISSELTRKIHAIWESRVQNKFVYRGMDRGDLIFPLNPAQKPFESNKSLILNFFTIIDEILETGLEFEIIEDHFGNKCFHNPRNLVKWSRRDLEIDGIDCTSLYQSAKEYSDCWQGSQLKQNLKSLTSYILEHMTTPQIKEVLTSKKLEIINEVETWLNVHRKPQPVILHISREIDIFHKTEKIKPLGSKQKFTESILENMASNKIKQEELEKHFNPETEEFYCSICRPLTEKDIYKIEQLS